MSRAWRSATGSRRPRPPTWRRATPRRTIASTACPSARAAASSPATTFPADGEYKFSIQNFGIGSFIPDEQLALIIDGERAHVWPYRGVGLAVGMTADTDGTLEVTVPVRAGSRLVGATFLATNYRPSLDIIRQYDRKSLENNSIPQLQYYPAIGFVRIQGPFNAQRPADSASRRRGRSPARPTMRQSRSESDLRAADPDRRWRAAPTAGRRRRRRSRRC